MTLMHGLTGADGAVFAEMLQQFGKANPQACFQAQGVPWDLFFQKYPTAVAAGTPPDMVIFHATEAIQNNSQGLMQPMDEWYTTTGIGKDQYNDALIKAITIDGKTMAVPFDNHGWILWYNMDLVKKAGLDPNTMPKNGDEFIQWATKVTTDKNGKHPGESGFDQNNVQVFANFYSWNRYTTPSTLWQYGTAVISDDGKKATLDSPEAIKAIQYWHDLMYKYFVTPPWSNTISDADLYGNGRLVSMWEGTWMGGWMRDHPDYAKVTKPAFVNSLAPDGKAANKFDSHIFSIPTGVSPDRMKPAYAMAEYLVKNGSYWANSGQVPALKSVQNLDAVQAHESVAVAAKEFNAQGKTDFPHKAFVEIQTAYETAIGNALASADADVAKALHDGATRIQSILDRG
jgi:ABC-type glycerol-3-phosphate transport system substrate-binding protein